MRRKNVVFLVIDGLADEPIAKKTPLSEANTPNFDFFAENGITGELNLVPKSLPVWSHIADVSLLGFNPSRYYLKRGPLEAIAANIPLKGDFLAVRINFATIDENGVVIDRRAGRGEYGLSEIARSINKEVDIGVRFVFLRTYGHRAVLVLKGKFSDRVSANDPLEVGKLPKLIKPLEKSSLSKLTAKILQDFLDKSQQIMEFHPINFERINKGYLPANYLLMRDPGNRIPNLPNFVEKWKLKNAICISEPGVTKSIAMLAGFASLTFRPKNLKHDLNFIFENISDSLSEYRFVLAHIKGPDLPAHDGDFQRKVQIIEKIDEKLEMFKSFNGILVITTDHITSCKRKKHLHGPVPVLVYGTKKKDRVKKFDEFSAKKGKLKKYTGSKLWKFVFGNLK
ncbi:MAG: 2,3-bisphosphoglycerate-independent phosphoglycerate mutase [Candidatus Aenigmarchaeota archaeon]|nr:2,3-bisphosphoglycerate-independent phosphoglycerate mutase [Candidatus Aenigmarchaeota archaeon]